MEQNIFSILKDEFQHNDIPQKDGISIMLNKKHLEGDNGKYMNMYNSMSIGYDLAETIVGKIKYGNQIAINRTYMMSQLEWKDNAKVLYTSIGTGKDLKYIPASLDKKSLHLAGLDISFGMLKQCHKKFRKDFNLSLFNCAAEELPFIDNSFDIVFHVGGINFFSDKESAIKEMIRVAKPGTRIMIADETADYIDSQYKNSRLSKKYFKDQEFNLDSLVQFVPENVKERNVELIWENKFYILTFRK
jgi:ubiquinone/menaquinone biosynthesis C-methylase UbiE